MLRQAQCLIRLARFKEGLLALQKCQAALDFCKLGDDKKVAIVKDITALETEAGKLESNSKMTMENSSTLELNNPELPGASPHLGLEVSNDRVKGRFVTAKEDIEVICIELSFGFYITFVKGGRGFIPRVSLQLRASAFILLQPLQPVPGTAGGPSVLQVLHTDQILQV